MIVSHFTNHSNTTPDSSKDIGVYLDDIKNGKYRDLILEIRSKKTKEERDVLKARLSGCCFTGKFSRRAIAGLSKPSHIAILDFDKFKDVQKAKEYISNVKYTFACWISPSGDGVKALCKIPPVNTNEDYKDYVIALYDVYNLPDNSDTGTCDISRFCYDSYDPELYLNEKSDLFTDRIVREDIEYIHEETNIPIKDQNEIANRLMVWFRKRWTGTDRNTNLHALARQFNAFGVDKQTCINYLFPYQQPDFKEDEIRQLINSAYRYTSEHGTKSFEDTQQKNKLKTLITTGKSDKEIISKFKDYDKDKLDQEIRQQREKINFDTFWDYDKNGNVRMNPFKFKKYIENKNIYKYYPSSKDGFTYIIKDKNFINEILTTKVKDMVLEELENRSEIDAFNMVAASDKAFRKDFLSMIETAKVDINRDTKQYGMFYYRNKAVKISGNNIELIDYNDLDGFIWEDTIIDRDIDLGSESSGEYKRFVWLISGEDVNKYYAFKSVIGYLLHSYKDNSLNKSTIFNDITISDNPNGGSGKGLFHKGLAQIKKVSIIDGKHYDPSDRFRFQTVDLDAQIVLFDDVKKNFNFENLFSVITEGFPIEKKGQDAIFIPYKISPKISITTNNTIKGEGGSHRRRRHELEMSDYFNDGHSPFDEFGHSLFDDWDEKEWKAFDTFMIRCVQYYLNNGLIEFPLTNLEYRKLQDNTNQDFIDWVESKTFEGRIIKNDFTTEFFEEFDEYKMNKFVTKRTVLKWMDLYAKYKGWKYTEGNSNGQRWFEIVKNGKEEKATGDDTLPF